MALFTAQAALKHGLPFHLYATEPAEPAALAFAEYCSYGPLGDADALSAALSHCTHIVLENEFWSPLQLTQALAGKAFLPQLESYQMVFGKVAQRSLIQKLNIAQPDYRIIKQQTELIAAFHELKGDVIIKQNIGGYDGLGNRQPKNLDEAIAAALDFGMEEGQLILVEQALNIKREIALTFFANSKHMTFFPIVETVQESHVCTHAISPALITDAQKQQLESVAKHIAGAKAHGLFTIEFFCESDGPWLYNEIAPRPHNSQHLSMDNCAISQYEAIIFEVLEKELPAKILHTSDAVMVNILGLDDCEHYQLALPKTPDDIEIHTYMYGKKRSRRGRKLGHLTLIGNRIKILNEAKSLIQEYKL